MSKRNVPISSLLDSNSEDAVHVVRSATSSPKQAAPADPSSLSNFVSKFRTSIEVSPSPGQGYADPHRPYVVPDDSEDVPVVGKGTAKKAASRKPVAIRPSPLPVLIPKPQATPSISPAPLSPRGTSKAPVVVSDSIKKFQTSFQLPAQPYNRTSINSIINIDDEPELVNVQTASSVTPGPNPALAIPSTNPPVNATPPAPPKKKRAAPKKKTDEAAKKRKTDDATNNDDKKTTKAKSADPKSSETKKTSKSKKKTPEATPTVAKSEYEKLPIHPGMTTDKAKTSGQPPQLPGPTVIDLLNPMKEDEPIVPEEKVKEEPKEKKEEKVDPPIIALNIPLIDPKNPKPGQSEVVINVLRLSEEKYGWSVIHPKAKSAIDIMDDMIDDEDDAMDEDEDEEVIVDEEKAPAPLPSKKKKDEELTEEQLVRQHEVKMNRKVGKYDYEDPFIDDEELQMEEEITSTKEGFFVYWGPLVDDRNMTSSGTKKTSKAKK